MKDIEISELVNTEYREFARYTCFDRALPSMIDGFKPTQRKLFLALRGKREFTKVLSIAGEIISSYNYHHGDASACDTVVKMTQDFAGENNIPVFIGKGSFGNRFVKDASAPRYIYAKPNPEFYKFYKDFELCEADPDPENVEPQYFLPVIPTIFINGTEGIAVGHATMILPYKISDIKQMIEKYLDDGTLNFSPTPFYKGFNGEIKHNGEKFVMHGKYEKITDHTIKITELPVKWNREKYNLHLTSLIEKGLITSFKNDTKTEWNIKIKLPKDSVVFTDIDKYLKMSSVLSENLTVLNEKKEIVVFPTINDLLKYFIDFRLGIYEKRKTYMMTKLKNDILFNQTKISFIRVMGKIDFQNMKKTDIKEFILSKGCRPDFLDRLMELPVHRLSGDEIKKTEEQIKEMKDLYVWYKNITVVELYKIDLREI